MKIATRPTSAGRKLLITRNLYSPRASERASEQAYIFENTQFGYNINNTILHHLNTALLQANILVNKSVFGEEKRHHSLKINEMIGVPSALPQSRQIMNCRQAISSSVDCGSSKTSLYVSVFFLNKINQATYKKLSFTYLSLPNVMQL